LRERFWPKRRKFWGSVTGFENSKSRVKAGDFPVSLEDLGAGEPHTQELKSKVLCLEEKIDETGESFGC
jgi:hypothetical protein